MKDKSPTTRIVRQLRGGQITIPADFRRKLRIEDESLLQLTLAETEGELRIRPVEVTRKVAGSPWLKELYEYFAPAREAAARHSEEEINADIDQAVAEVRQRHDQGRP